MAVSAGRRPCMATLRGAAASPRVVRAPQAGRPTGSGFRAWPKGWQRPAADFWMTDMGKLSRILAVVGSLAVLAPGLVEAPAFAQAGSTGGIIGKQDKSISGGGEESSREPRAKPHATHRASAGPGSEPRSEARSGSADGTWAVSATPGCLPPWRLTALVSEGVISGGATGLVSRAGAVRGNAVVLGFKFDFVGHVHGGHASGTLVDTNGCAGQWTATRS